MAYCPLPKYLALSGAHRQPPSRPVFIAGAGHMRAKRALKAALDPLSIMICHEQIA
jgi:hypothetical protein